MGVKAVGSYIGALRAGNKLSVADVVATLEQMGIETSSPYIWRIEHGDISSPGARLLNAITLAVHGNLEHITQLLLKTESTEEEGHLLAQQWLNGGKQAATPLPSELENLVRDLVDDPLRLRQWIGYGERLLDERQAVGQL